MCALCRSERVQPDRNPGAEVPRIDQRRNWVRFKFSSTLRVPAAITWGRILTSQKKNKRAIHAFAHANRGPECPKQRTRLERRSIPQGMSPQRRGGCWKSRFLRMALGAHTETVRGQECSHRSSEVARDGVSLNAYGCLWKDRCHIRLACRDSFGRRTLSFLKWLGYARKAKESLATFNAHFRHYRKYNPC